jgi:hypothetical protein
MKIESKIFVLILSTVLIVTVAHASRGYAEISVSNSTVDDYVNSLPHNTNAQFGKRVTILYESPQTLIMDLNSNSLNVAGEVIDFAKQKGYNLDFVNDRTERSVNTDSIVIFYTVFMSK